MKSRQRRFAAFGLTAVVMAGVAAAVGYLGSARLSAAQPTLQLVNPGYLTVGTYGTVIPRNLSSVPATSSVVSTASCSPPSPRITASS